MIALKILTEPQTDHQVKLIVEIDPEKVEEAKRRTARQVAKRTRIPGFRPGKAPFNVVQRLIGDQALLEESVEMLVKDLYPQVLVEAKVNPYGPGQLDAIPSWNPLVLEFIVPLEAEVVLGDYRSLRFPYEFAEIKDEEVERALTHLRERQAVDETVDRPAQEGDRVSVHLHGKRVRPQASDPGEAAVSDALIAERSMTYIIRPEGDPSAVNWPFPGFDRHLIGMAAGEEKIIPYAFPDDSEFTSLAGVSAEFWVKVDEVKSHTLPQLDDEFAKTNGEYSTLDELITAIRNDLAEHAREQYHSEYDSQIIEALISGATIKYPSVMLKDEMDEVMRNLENQLKSRNLDLPTYMKTEGLDEAGLREEVRPVAEQRLKRTLVLSQVARLENIAVDKDEVQAEAERTFEAMARFMSQSELRKMTNENLLQNLVASIAADNRIKRTLAHLRAIARGEMATPAVTESTGAEMAPETDPATIVAEIDAEAETVEGDASAAEVSGIPVEPVENTPHEGAPAVNQE
jgi:trigger factor